MKSFLPPNSERGDVFTSLAEGHNAYREVAFAAPPREEGAANNQGHAQPLHRYQRCQGSPM